jgi:predicted RecB family endonuclease
MDQEAHQHQKMVLQEQLTQVVVAVVEALDLEDQQLLEQLEVQELLF